MNAKTKGIRIYSWGRFLIFVLVLVLISFMIGGFVFKSTVSGMDEPEFRTIVVSAGDTLWDIADEHSENGDVRSLVQDICSINNIAASDLYPGQAIKIPAV